MLAPPGNKVQLHIEIIGQAKFPELIGDVLACVGGSAIAFDHDFVAGVIAFVGLRFSITERHHPAARQWASLWMFQHATIAQHFEGAFPQARAENGRLPG